MPESYTAEFQDFRAGTAIQPFKQDGIFVVVVANDITAPRIWRARIQGAARQLGASSFSAHVAKLRVESYFRFRLTPWSRVK